MMATIKDITAYIGQAAIYACKHKNKLSPEDVMCIHRHSLELLAEFSRVFGLEGIKETDAASLPVQLFADVCVTSMLYINRLRSWGEEGYVSQADYYINQFMNNVVRSAVRGLLLNPIVPECYNNEDVVDDLESVIGKFLAQPLNTEDTVLH